MDEDYHGKGWGGECMKHEEWDTGKAGLLMDKYEENYSGEALI